MKNIVLILCLSAGVVIFGYGLYQNRFKGANVSLIGDNSQKNIVDLWSINRSFTVEEVMNLINHADTVLIDVRTSEEWDESGTISGARMIDFYANDFEDQIISLPKDKKYILYCRSGNRSNKARILMREKGFIVNDMQGGIIERNNYMK